MATSSFSPIEEVSLYCRKCKKVMPAQLERSIAGSGRTVDKDSTFEYFCTKCHQTICILGSDLLPSKTSEDADAEPKEDRIYSANEHYFIGETIYHKSFDDSGVVVAKDHGSTNRILVQFKDGGIKKLVEDI